MTATESYYEADGVRMRYLVCGTGKSLLYLHGYGLAADSYLKLIESLSSKYKVIAPDLPGFGKSSMPPTVWDVEGYRNFLCKFIGHLNLSDYVLIGYSLGCSIALAIACRNPAVSKLVLASAAATPTNYSLFKLFYLTGVTKFIHDYRKYDHGLVKTQYKKAFYLNLFKNIFYAPRMAGIVNKAKQAIINIDLSEGLSTLALMAKNDEYFPLKEQQRLIENIPNATAKVLDEYHDWLLFKPEILINELGNWL